MAACSGVRQAGDVRGAFILPFVLVFVSGSVLDDFRVTRIARAGMPASLNNVRCSSQLRNRISRDPQPTLLPRIEFEQILHWPALGLSNAPGEHAPARRRRSVP